MKYIAAGLLAVLALAQTATTPPAPVAAITPAAAPKIYVNVPAIRMADGTYTIHPTIKLVRALCVYRNGMRMAPSIDYTYVSATGAIVPKRDTNWQAADIILLDFQI